MDPSESSVTRQPPAAEQSTVWRAPDWCSPAMLQVPALLQALVVRAIAEETDVRQERDVVENLFADTSADIDLS
jgi:hypothetical protein